MCPVDCARNKKSDMNYYGDKTLGAIETTIHNNVGTLLIINVDHASNI